MLADYKWFFMTLFVTFLLILYQQWLEVHDWQQNYEINTTKAFIQPEHEYQLDIEVGEIASNCGILTTCPDNSFPLHLSTGSDKDDQPKLCISGKYVIQKGVNSGGRGLNGAIIESVHFHVVSVKNFDSYATNSSGLESWLQYNILDNDILILFTFDEASKELSLLAKNILYELGSGKVQDLHYRAQWYMITQKGTKGFTRYEKLTYSKNNKWGEAIDLRECIPRVIPKENSTYDLPPRENVKRINFCRDKTSDEWKNFCGDMVYEPILPALLTNRSLIGNPVFSMPVYVYASNNVEMTISALETLIHQPGVHLPSIVVLFKDSQQYIANLSDVYGVKSQEVKFADTSHDKIIQVLEINDILFPQHNYTIIIEDEVILSPDFLFYMAQLFHVLQKDETLVGISAMSPNCYDRYGDVHLAYRIESVFKYGMLVSSNRRNLILSNESVHVIVPDVSRLQSPELCHLPSLEPDNWIERPQDLTKERYFHKLVMLLQLSYRFDVNLTLINCSIDYFSNVDKKVIAVYYKNDNFIFASLLKCFGTTSTHNGRFKGIFRLTVNDKIVLLLSNDSPFFKSRPLVTE